MTLAYSRRLAVCICLLAALAGQSGATMAQSGDSDSGNNSALTQTITAMDAKLFDAYNRCDLEQFAEYFTHDVEFYHDQGGVTWDRDTVVENTRKYICHRVRRELLPGTLRVYPIKDYGAIEEGEHRFCSIDSGKCEGVAKFLMIWENKGDKWRMTRVVSYGHRALSANENAPAH